METAPFKHLWKLPNNRHQCRHHTALVEDLVHENFPGDYLAEGEGGEERTIELEFCYYVSKRVSQ